MVRHHPTWNVIILNRNEQSDNVNCYMNDGMVCSAMGVYYMPWYKHNMTHSPHSYIILSRFGVINRKEKNYNSGSVLKLTMSPTNIFPLSKPDFVAHSFNSNVQSVLAFKWKSKAKKITHKMRTINRQPSELCSTHSASFQLIFFIIIDIKYLTLKIR